MPVQPTVKLPPNATSAVPRVAIVGWCERSGDVTKGHPALWSTNIIGLRPNLVFTIFPVNLRGHRLALAIYGATKGETIQLLFRPRGQGKPFDISMTIDAGVVEPTTGSLTLSKDEMRIDGWCFDASPLAADVVVNEPGPYDVYIRDGENERFVWSTHFFSVLARPFAEEEWAAIKSDPDALKIVRAEYSCKACGSRIRAYTGVGKSAKLESDGFIWQHDLPARFECSCGQTSLNLEYLKRGMHLLLKGGRGHLDSPGFACERLYERSALEETCREFTRLLDERPDEHQLQRFLKDHEVFFSKFTPTKIIPKPDILNKFEADFGIVTDRKELVLVEIERGDTQIIKGDGGVCAELSHAVDQVRSWLQVMNEHRHSGLSCIGLEDDEVVKVRGVVIAGRTPSDEALARCVRTFGWPDIEFYTYDDIIAALREIVRHVSVI